MADSDPLLVPLDTLPEPVVENVRRATRDHTLPLIANNTHLGTGTLVQIDQWAGILTAEHVVHPDKQDLWLDYTGHPERHLRTSIGSFAHDLSISTNALRIVTTARLNDDHGPDLAFIALPESPFLHELRARKSFYNLTLNVAKKTHIALTDAGFFALCGFPSIKDFSGPAEHGFTTTTSLCGYVMFSGPESYEHPNDWDYFEVRVSQECANEFERKFGGVSGGGVWRVLMIAGQDAPPGDVLMGDLALAGVAFYEMDDRGENHFFVRAHGPVSIYDTFIDLVRNTLTSALS
jgi:hypothetical protein